jgi:hypothetical protein
MVGQVLAVDRLGLAWPKVNVSSAMNRPAFGGDFLAWKDLLHAEAVPEELR